MKRLYFLFMLIILGICVNAQDGRVTIVGNKFYVGDKPIWFNGINTPWHKFQSILAGRILIRHGGKLNFKGT
jgi:hypothetical protein